MEQLEDLTKPTYSKEVKIHDWQNAYLGYPQDNEFPNHPTASHYKSLGPNNNVYIPKTTTQEAMENGISNSSSLQTRKRSVVNFTSYLITDKQIRDNEAEEDNKKLKLTKRDDLISTYTLSYYKSFQPKEDPCRNAEVHFLMNRLSVNICDAALRSSNKFLDDHLFHKDASTKCSEYLKRIRKTSLLEHTGKFEDCEKKIKLEKLEKIK